MKRRIIILTICICLFSVMPAFAASQSGSVNGVNYTVACNPSTFRYNSQYTHVTTTASFSRTKPECNLVSFGLISNDVIATANSAGFMEASTGNYCCSTGKIVYKEVTTVYAGTLGHRVTGFKKNGKTYIQKYSLSSKKNANGMSQNQVSDVYLKFPKYIQKNHVIYAAQSGSINAEWKKFSRSNNDHKKNSQITVSSTYGISKLKMNPNVSSKGCSISISKTVKTGGLVKTHAYR